MPIPAFYGFDTPRVKTPPAPPPQVAEATPFGLKHKLPVPFLHSARSVMEAHKAADHTVFLIRADQVHTAKPWAYWIEGQDLWVAFKPDGEEPLPFLHRGMSPALEAAIAATAGDPQRGVVLYGAKSALDDSRRFP